MKKRKRKTPMILRILIGLLVTGVFFTVGMVGYVAFQESLICRNILDIEDYDAIIVLGAQVRSDGTPSVQLSWRLDASAEAWKMHQVPIIVCGAQGKDEPMPEAEAMQKYLISKGIPENSIYQDPDSFNTSQNLQNAKAMLLKINNKGKVLIVSSDYHVPRAMALARDQGLNPIGLGAPCKAEYWIKNHFREALAWVKYGLNKYLNISL